MSTVKSFIASILLATPGTPTVTPARPAAPANPTAVAGGTPGAQSVVYTVVGYRADGTFSLVSADATVADSHATIDATNFNTIAWTAMAAATTYKVYRKSGGATQGLIATVTAPTVTVNDTGLVGDASTPEAGSSSSYKIVAKTALGNVTAAGSAGSTTTGYATPGGALLNAVSWTAVTGAYAYDVYRDTGGATQGLIGTVLAPLHALDDTGLPGDSATAPTVNTTGDGTALECLALDDKTIQLGGTFVATVQFQGSVNGIDWADEGATKTATAILEVTEAYTFMRMKITAYTSGTPTAVLAGHS